MRLSSTLTSRALSDLRRELKRSRDVFGPAASDRMRDRSLERFRQVADGTAIGHRHRAFDGAPEVIRCVSVAPLLVVFDADRRLILAIIDGRRDIAAIVARRLDAS